METVAIVGVGLIGGSFGLALRQAGFRGRILGVSSPPAVRDALARGAIDEALPLEPAVEQADLVYLAQPISRILDTLPRLEGRLRPGALVTDAGSTKAAIVAEAHRSVRSAQFLGGHPMAGKETRGAAEAEPALFTGRTYALTPRSPDELETPPARDFIAWVRAIGAIPVTVAPDEHDRIAAFTSHLPQLLSTALASTLTRAAGDLRIAGPGLADALRLAASSYEVWGDILDTNAAAIDAALARFIAQLETIRARLGAPGALKTEFEQANQLAARLRRSR